MFRNHATWLVQPGATAGFDTIKQWNRGHPDEAMQMAYNYREWMLDDWELPTFYFLKSGKSSQVIGWPDHKGEVQAALRRFGLM